MRFFLLSGHYRNPINFSDTLMEQAKAGLARMENAGTENALQACASPFCRPKAERFRNCRKDRDATLLPV